MMGEGAGAGAGDVSMAGGGTGTTTTTQISHGSAYKTGVGGEADLMVVDVGRYVAGNGHVFSTLKVEVMEDMGQKEGSVISSYFITRGEISDELLKNFSEYLDKPYGPIWAEAKEYRSDRCFRAMMRAPVNFQEWSLSMKPKALQRVMEELWVMAQITPENWMVLQPSMKFYICVDPDGLAAGWRCGVHKEICDNQQERIDFTSVTKLGELFTSLHLPMSIGGYFGTCMTVEGAVCMDADTARVASMMAVIHMLPTLQNCMWQIAGKPDDLKVTTENLWQGLKPCWRGNAHLLDYWNSEADGCTPIDFSRGGDEREFAGMMLARLYALSNPRLNALPYLKTMATFEVDVEEGCIEQYKREGFFGNENAEGEFDGKNSYMLPLLSRFYEEVRLNQERHGKHSRGESSHHATLWHNGKRDCPV